MNSSSLIKSYLSNLKRLREKSGYTQKQVANILGITERAFQNYELGARFPSIDNFKILSNIYKVKLEDIFFENTKYNTLTITLNSNEEVNLFSAFEEYAQAIDVSVDFLFSYTILSTLIKKTSF